jgi:hypothetical protein
MDEKLTCPNVARRDVPPKEADLMDEACNDCPALLREVDEAGRVAFHCLVYRNTFRSPGAALHVTTKPPTKASWSRERLP